MELLSVLWHFLMAAGNLFTTVFFIVLPVLLVFRKDVRDAWSVLINTMVSAMHVHFYRDKDGWQTMPSGYPGETVQARTRYCRCGAFKRKILF